MIALSLKRLNKNGWTESPLSGPPKLNKTIAMRFFSIGLSIDIPVLKARPEGVFVTDQTVI
jgi:hypothetical protein